jgi:hypothetical protein
VPKVPQPQKSFWTHPMEPKSDMGYVESCFDAFGESVGVGAR